MTPEHPIAARGGSITAWLAVLVLACVVALTWFAYRAVHEWQSNAAQLIQRRQQDVALSLTINMIRDMRAVQIQVLDRRDWGRGEMESPHALGAVLGPVLEHYAYPEVFFAWAIPAEPKFLARTSRMPSWAAPGDQSAGIRWFSDAAVGAQLRSRVLADAGSGHQYSIFRLEINGTPYQVVTRFLRGASAADYPTAVLGFMVNMDWAKTYYFAPRLASLMSGVSASIDSPLVVDPKGIEFTLLDDKDKPTGARAAIPLARAPTSRRFNAYFFDTPMVSTEAAHDLDFWTWHLQVSAAEDPTVAIALRGARRTILVVAAASLALGIGLMVIVRATRAAAAVASMRSEFVSTVTHELKTPMAVIQSIGETMVRGRVSSPEQQREYAQLLVQETYRLRHLIDNLLAYARITEVADVYAFEALHPEEVVEEALLGFRKLLRDRGIDVTVAVPKPLPCIRGDRTSILFALDNLIDNAMRHGRTRHIDLEARLGEKAVEFVISDRGRGIPEDELKRVQQPFVRGGATDRGSGLGLAIVRRIAAAHRGWVKLDSRVDVGTTATLGIPVSEA